MTSEDLESGDDLRITKTTRRAAGNGTWVCGTFAGHRFDALVFPEHADNPDWEIGDSRISKLWVQRLADRRTVFNWDRGASRGRPGCGGNCRLSLRRIGRARLRSLSRNAPRGRRGGWFPPPDDGSHDH